MRLLKLQRNQKGETHMCSCNSPKHLHNLWPVPAVAGQCSLHQQFMARPACAEGATAALRGTGADPPVFVPAPQEVFLAYCAGDARKSYWSAKPSCIIYFAFHHELVVRSLHFREQYWGLHSVPSIWTYPATSMYVAVDSSNCNSLCAHTHTYIYMYTHTIIWMDAAM